VGQTTCNTCRHWQSKDGKQGECCRYPPTAAAVPERSIGADRSGAPREMIVHRNVALWPPVGATSGCGEHQARERVRDD
jgi:hypothetical protein